MYGASKLENILFTKELQRRVDASSRDFQNFKAFSLHPGGVRTDLARNLVGEDRFVSMMDEKKPSFSTFFNIQTAPLLLFAFFTKSVERGAVTQIWLASGKGEDSLRGGEYLIYCKSARVASPGTDMETAKKLWQISEKMSGVHFDF